MNDRLEAEYIQLQEILARVDAGVTLITGNLRLAQALLSRFDQYCLASNKMAWETPDIIPWSTWIERSFNSLLHHHADTQLPLLLSPQQERLLWEQVIEETSAGHQLLQLAATAQQCAKSWDLMHDWQLSRQDYHYHLNEDSERYLVWHDAISEKCRRHGWITRSQIPGKLIEMIHAGQLNLPGSIILTGFDELTPLQRRLFDCVSSSGCDVSWLEKAGQQGKISVFGFDHERDEIEAAARWARAILEKQQRAAIAVVVPELARLRQVVQGIFDRVMIPESIKPEHRQVQRPYNISLGSALISCPFVQTALYLLSWDRYAINIESLSIVLNSPFMAGWQQERYARALLDRQLREMGRMDYSLALVIRYASHADTPCYCPRLSSLLLAYQKIVTEAPAHAKAATWSSFFTGLLDAVGYGQGRTLSSEEFQTAEAWKALLTDLVRIDSLGIKLQYRQAARVLRQMARERIFQPRTEELPLQILGVMEATGLEFDYLWVTGLHDGVWPPAPRPDPFIPVTVQRKRMMPHASARRELQFAALMTDRLAGNAGVVHFSFPSQNNDEMLRPSPLLVNYPTGDRSDLQLWPQDLWPDKIFESSDREPWYDVDVPLVDMSEVRGGSQLFRLQANCPFRAFAELRLHARPLTEPALGLDPAQRGSLLHQVMELIWQKIPDQQGLLSMSGKALEDLIRDCINQALDSLEKNGCSISQGYRGLEQNRLKILIGEWLAIEKQRQPFTVYATELALEIEIRDLPVRLKIDRIDELENGERIVIDYKTGSVSPSQWFGERPQEPQLPLYSLACTQQLNGLVYALLRPGEIGFRGITKDDNVIQGVKSAQQHKWVRELGGWEALLGNWQQTIETLAIEFRNGYAVVDPVNYPTTCLYCGLGQLCRIDSLRESAHIHEAER